MQENTKVIGEIKTVNFLHRGEEWFNVIAIEDEYYATDQMIDVFVGTEMEQEIPLVIKKDYVREWHEA